MGSGQGSSPTSLHPSLATPAHGVPTLCSGASDLLLCLQTPVLFAWRIYSCWPRRSQQEASSSLWSPLPPPTPGQGACPVRRSCSTGNFLVAALLTMCHCTSLWGDWICNGLNHHGDRHSVRVIPCSSPRTSQNLTCHRGPINLSTASGNYCLSPVM